MESKFKILSLVTHVLDPDKTPMLVLGVVERPSGFTYLCTRHDNNENEYFESEIIKY